MAKNVNINNWELTRQTVVTNQEQNNGNVVWERNQQTGGNWKA